MNSSMSKVIRSCALLSVKKRNKMNYVSKKQSEREEAKERQMIIKKIYIYKRVMPKEKCKPDISEAHCTNLAAKSFNDSSSAASARKKLLKIGSNKQRNLGPKVGPSK